MDLQYTLIILVVLAVLLVMLGVRSVPQGYNYTVERFGRFLSVLQPGLNIIIPIVDSIGRKLNMMEQVLDIPRQDAITKDNANVKIDAVLFFQVIDPVRAAYQVSHLEWAIVNLATTNIRTVMGGMDLDESLSRRDSINVRLLDVIDKATEPWGIKVTRVEIKDIELPQGLSEAMHQQMKAEREKRAAVLLAEGDRDAAIRRAEGSKLARIQEAEGELKAAELHAKAVEAAAMGDAKARTINAEAEAEATNLMSAAINNGNTQSINYFVSLKYMDALKTLAASPSNKTTILPVELTNVLGSIAGISELIKSSKTVTDVVKNNK
ncbi:SPFH domain-containing protein [Desulfovibrio litoralis]|uniref:Protein QmcA n=1 Tax=Desulfovibrio litoralis DSM 11393 TaxID=1121455 RepID=A0A1M7TIC3_9BACT|nr:SPFH domain-containing protein [Desulfovibrio litoralis]SHN70475.1 Regulator of protease activity HflC, stomatin/prohibitin superfamily [Desulfovibrio litoralis DSM 11393]